MNFALNKAVVSTFLQRSTIPKRENHEASEYILLMDITKTGNEIIVAVSDHNIVLHNSSSLEIIGKFTGHSDTINAIETSKTRETIFYSGSADKTFKVWDIRYPIPMYSITYECDIYAFSVSLEDSLLAIGVDDVILFQDLQKLPQHTDDTHTTIQLYQSFCNLGSYSDVHSDFITILKFHPDRPQLLFSASDDGLICVFDVSTAQSDDAVVSILNTECPVSRFGFFGAQNEGVYCVSTIETASCWHFPSAQRISNFQQLREQYEVDYVIDCFTYKNPTTNMDDLHLLCGKHTGEGLILSLAPSGVSTVTGFLRQNGHNTTLRCCKLINNFLVTGAEDSRVCSWDLGKSATENTLSNLNSNAAGQVGNTQVGITRGGMGGSGAMRGKKKNQVRHHPYSKNK